MMVLKVMPFSGAFSELLLMIVKLNTFLKALHSF